MPSQWMLHSPVVLLDNVVTYHLKGITYTPYCAYYLYTDMLRNNCLFLSKVEYTTDGSITLYENELLCNRYFTFPRILRTFLPDYVVVSFIDTAHETRELMLIKIDEGSFPKIVSYTKEPSIIDPPKLVATLANQILCCQIQNSGIVTLDIYSIDTYTLRKVSSSVMTHTTYTKVNVEYDPFLHHVVITAQSQDGIRVYLLWSDTFGNVSFIAEAFLEVSVMTHSIINIGKGCMALIYISSEDNFTCHVGLIRYTASGTITIVPNLYKTQHTGITRLNTSVSMDMRYLFISYTDHRYEYFSSISIFEIIQLMDVYNLISDIELPIILVTNHRDNNVVSIVPICEATQLVVYTDMQHSKLLGTTLSKK